MTWLERHDDEINLHRFYATEISRDLFGTWLLTRRWGRVGRGGGQALVQSFRAARDALAAEADVIGRKRRRGYQMREEAR